MVEQLDATNIGQEIAKDMEKGYFGEAYDLLRSAGPNSQAVIRAANEKLKADKILPGIQLVGLHDSHGSTIHKNALDIIGQDGKTRALDLQHKMSVTTGGGSEYLTGDGGEITILKHDPQPYVPPEPEKKPDPNADPESELKKAEKLESEARVASTEDAQQKLIHSAAQELITTLATGKQLTADQARRVSKLISNLEHDDDCNGLSKEDEDAVEYALKKAGLRPADEPAALKKQEEESDLVDTFNFDNKTLNAHAQSGHLSDDETSKMGNYVDTYNQLVDGDKHAELGMAKTMHDVAGKQVQDKDDKTDHKAALEHLAAQEAVSALSRDGQLSAEDIKLIQDLYASLKKDGIDETDRQALADAMRKAGVSATAT